MKKFVFKGFKLKVVNVFLWRLISGVIVGVVLRMVVVFLEIIWMYFMVGICGKILVVSMFYMIMERDGW